MSASADRFSSWMHASAPAGAAPRNYTLIDSTAESVPGALADIWSEVCAALESNDGPSLRVVLLPHVSAFDDFSSIQALKQHLLSCRDCCDDFGRRVHIQCLHPESSSLSSAPPCPFVTLSSRVGPSELRPPQAEVDTSQTEASEELASLSDAPERDLEAARLFDMRRSLERIVAADADSAATSAIDGEAETEKALEATVSWFAEHFGRVARALRGRQRRIALARFRGEDVYAAFWREAAILSEPERGSAPSACEAAFESPSSSSSSPLSSLVVLATPDADAVPAEVFRKLFASLTLGLAMLQLTKQMRVSAVHPVDTFQTQIAADGTTAWVKTLPHPLLHVVAMPQGRSE